jgi:hypothetical protein
MTKTIAMTPDVMLKFLASGKLRELNVPLSPGAKVVRSGYNPTRNEFWADVQSDSFENPANRLPQEFRLEIQK